MRRKIIIANWKENKTNDEVAGFIIDLKGRIYDIRDIKLEIVICPSLVSIITANDCVKGSIVKIGAQNISEHDKGAYTGEVSARMIKEFCEYVIIGHSERRNLFGETDDVVNKKLHNAIINNIKPILCLGEDIEQKNSNQTENVIFRQLESGLKNLSVDNVLNVIIAYEPVWAISRGDPSHISATPTDAGVVHSFIRTKLSELYNDEISSQIRIIYGGSVKSDNIKEFLEKEDIDGALVGSASLDIESLMRILDN